MADDRGRPLVIGALTAVTGAVLFLAAGDVIPLPDQTFGGPRWLVGLLGLGFFFGGCYAIALALPTPRMRRLLGGRREPDIPDRRSPSLDVARPHRRPLRAPREWLPGSEGTSARASRRRSAQARISRTLASVSGGRR